MTEKKELKLDAPQHRRQAVQKPRYRITPLRIAKAAAEVIVIGLIMEVSVTCGLLSIVGAVIPLLGAEGK